MSELSVHDLVGGRLLGVVVNASTGQEATIEDFSLLGLMASDGSEITDVQLHGVVATEQFLDGADCQSTAITLLLNPTCVACTTSSTGYCMEIDGTADNSTDPTADPTAGTTPGAGTPGDAVPSADPLFVPPLFSDDPLAGDR